MSSSALPVRDETRLAMGASCDVGDSNSRHEEDCADPMANDQNDFGKSTPYHVPRPAQRPSDRPSPPHPVIALTRRHDPREHSTPSCLQTATMRSTICVVGESAP